MRIKYDIKNLGAPNCVLSLNVKNTQIDDDFSKKYDFIYYLSIKLNRNFHKNTTPNYYYSFLFIVFIVVILIVFKTYLFE